MKKFIIGAAAGAVMLGAMALPAFAVSEHASPMACFGQGRGRLCSKR